LFGFSAAVVQPGFKHLDRRYFNKNSEGFFTKIFFQVQPAFHIYIEDHIFSFAPDALNFRFQRTIKISFIDLFPFNEFIAVDLFLELLGCVRK
jgi:hypothetical protein